MYIYIVYILTLSLYDDIHNCSYFRFITVHFNVTGVQSVGKFLDLAKYQATNKFIFPYYNHIFNSFMLQFKLTLKNSKTDFRIFAL